MSEPTETHDTPQRHKVDIGNNVALAWLYILGVSGLVLGNLIVFIPAALGANSYEQTGPLFWISLGGSLGNAGLFFLIAALAVHAINWQIGRSGTRR